MSASGAGRQQHLNGFARFCDNQADFEAEEGPLLAGAKAMEGLAPVDTAAADADVAAHRHGKGVHDVAALRAALLVDLGQHAQGELPERFGKSVESSVEAALGEGPLERGLM